ncbi:hypothetical protein DMUE_3792, partial [Dictyocoela muelleri]
INCYKKAFQNWNVGTEREISQNVTGSREANIEFNNSFNVNEVNKFPAFYEIYDNDENFINKFEIDNNENSGNDTEKNTISKEITSITITYVVEALYTPEIFFMINDSSTLKIISELKDIISKIRCTKKKYY